MPLNETRDESARISVLETKVWMERFQFCFNSAFKFNLRLYITAVGSKEVLERWVFDIEAEVYTRPFFCSA